jgi:hypothetical protein
MDMNKRKFRSHTDTHLRTKREITWLEDLPLELQIHLMTLLFVNDLENFILFLDIPLNDVVQYVLGDNVSTKCNLSKVMLRDLDDKVHIPGINIVQVLKSPLLDKNVALLNASESINHTILRNFDNLYEIPLLEEKKTQCSLGKFIKSMSPNTRIFIKYSGNIYLRHLDMVLSRIHFQNVENLVLFDHTSDEKPLMKLNSIRSVNISWCSGIGYDYIDFESNSISKLEIVSKLEIRGSNERKLTLNHKVININGCDLETFYEVCDIVFNGKLLTCECATERIKRIL